MLNLLSKKNLSILLALLSLNTMNTSLMAWEECCDSSTYDLSECNRIYIGAFGGEIFSNSTKLSQMGTAFFTEASGGPLAVYAKGRTKKKSTGFGGVQLGYEWGQNSRCSRWNVAPAAEIEAYFYGHNKKGHLINPTDRLPEHDFADSFHMNASVCLINAVFSVRNSWCKLVPYIGGGIGAAHISIRNAKSLQVSPVEPGINHFNSKRDDTSWAFAAQAKAGVRYNVWERFHIFAEYRYLFLGSSKYILGSTVYPTHAPTSPWDIKMNNISCNAFSLGIQYDL